MNTMTSPFGGRFGRALSGLRFSTWVLMVAVAVAALPAGAAAPEADAGADRLREDVRRMMAVARDRVFPALVNIEVVTVRYWGGQERKGISVGSGTIISEDGYVVTNYHVTDNGQRFLVRLADKREIGARLVGEDPLTDLAVLQINLDELEDGETLPVAAFGDSAELMVGDYVMAMGSPLALSRSVTLGIVSNVERVFAGRGATAEELELDSGQRTGLFTVWIQHDAQIHPGNSGGPLVNLRGEIVGVNELGGPAGQGFAIPSNLAREVVAELIESGEVVRSWIGLSVRSIKDTGYEEGVVVNSVIDDSPADAGGLRAGDLITAIDGEPITVRFVEELPPLLKQIANRPVGSEVRFAYRRDGETGTAVVVTEKMKEDIGDENVFRGWGLTAMEITEKMARDRRLDSTAGVLVSGVRSAGAAQQAEPAMQPGDVIRTVAGRSIADLDQFIDVYAEIMDREPLPEFLLIEFDRGGKNHLTLLKPKPEKDEDPPRELPKAWIGVATQPVLTKLADEMGIPDVTGHRITRVYPRTKAAESELRVGDVIVALNDESVAPRTLQDAGMFSREVRRLDIGDDATVTVVRDGEQQAVAVELERTRIEPHEAHRDRNRDFELTVREVTFFDRDDRRWDEDVEGVIVEALENGGWADRGGLRSGDLIQRINDFEITGLRTYRRAMDRIADTQPERVVFVVLRGVQTSFLFVEPEWKPLTDEAEASASEDDDAQDTDNDE